MKKSITILIFSIFILGISIIGCVPMSEQIIGTWEFSGYKNGAIQSIIPTDCTICFEANGYGFYFPNSDATQKKDLTYSFSDTGTIRISCENKEKEVEFSVEWKATRLTLDGLVYRRIDSLTSIEKQSTALTITLSPTIPPTSTPVPSPTPKPKLVALSMNEHVVGLYEDGSVLTTRCSFPQNVESAEQWKDIVSVSAGYAYTAGIARDGTLAITSNFVAEYYTGDNLYTYTEPGDWIKEWTNLIQIDAGAFALAGVRADGTAVAVSGSFGNDRTNLSDWEDIIQVSVGDYFIAGLRSDGTVVTVGFQYDQDVQTWTDIVYISAGWDLYGVKKDGTVVATGYDREQCRTFVKTWTDIIKVDCEGKTSDVIGLKNDGTVVSAGKYYSQFNISEWNSIVDIASGGFNAVGLTSDGSVVSTNTDGSSDLGWFREW